MADPRHYSISIIENYSDKPLQEIALAVAKKIEKDISEDDFTLEDVEDLELETNFLTTEEAYTWYFVADDLAPMFADFPDTCFCLSVSDGEGGGQYRVLFFNGKYVTQYPEIRYPEFRLNDFEYETSGKKSLITKPQVNTDNLRKMITEMDERIETFFGRKHGRDVTYD